MRCLRRSIPLPPTHSPKLTRIIHTTPHRHADRYFTDDELNEYERTMEDIPRLPTKGDTIAYGRAAGEQGMRRWQESQDPQKRLKFMTMGREFAIPYNLTQFSYMSLNHMRELRTYYRKIMYEMPQFGLVAVMLMEEFARPFKPPNKFEVLRFRYSTYFGENHPAAKKVVLNFSMAQLRKAVSEDPRFDDAWEHKLKLLLGTRYNPTTDQVRMSCEQYPYPAQNKRWLSDKLDELMEAAATGESFRDIPIDMRHVRKNRIYKIPQEWLKLLPERQRAEQAVEEQIYQPALARCVELAKVEKVDDIPANMQKRLRAIVNSTVRHAARPGFFADLNDPRVREMVINESLKHLVWSFQAVINRNTEFITPDLSEEEFEKAFKAEQERIEAKKRDDDLQAEEDRKEKLYNRQQDFAKANVMDEMAEVTPAELERARQQAPSTTPEEDELDNMGLDDTMKKALKLREERRKLILSRLEEPEVPEWLKHAVDEDDTELFPMASGRFAKERNREDQLADFFQKELDECKIGSEEEAKILEFMDKLVQQEESGLVQEESVDEIKRRVNAMLKEIEDRNEQQ